MPKINLTKNELKIQKDDLKRFNRYLPMLTLKKQQLQAELLRVDNLIHSLLEKEKQLEEALFIWADVFAEDIDLSLLLKVKKIKTESGNIAGVAVPLFVEVEFEQASYDYLVVPLWVDQAIVALKELIIEKAKYLIAQRQRLAIEEELHITTQRVNLFEKIKIPQATENIRVIQIHLGDMQTVGVVRGKIAKSKLEKRPELTSS